MVLKICFFIPSLENGGAERVVSLLANELCVEHDINILMLNEKKSDYYIDPRVKLVPFNCVIDREHKGLLLKIEIIYNELKRIYKYCRFINKYKPDAIISMLYTTNIIAILSNYYLKKRLIVSERNDPTQYSEIRQKIIKKLYPKAEVLVCQSKKVAQYFESKNTRVIYNPIVNLIQSENKKNKNGGRIRVISVGRLIEQKNHELLINAVHNLALSGIDCDLDIYGEGPLRNKLQQLINSFEMNDNIKLRGFSKSIKQKLRCYDLFVLSSNFEGFPNVMVEAMSCDLPVVSSNFATGIAEELISESVNGYLFNVGDENGLILCLKKCIEEGFDTAKLHSFNVGKLSQFDVAKISKQWIEECKERRR